MDNVLKNARQFLLDYKLPEALAGSEVLYYHDTDYHKIQLNNEALANALRNEILLYGKKLEKDALPLGSSKIYGEPHWPEGWDWPRNSYFIAQFNLAEVQTYDWEQVLPQKGMLYFFQEDDYSFPDSTYDAVSPLKAFYYQGSKKQLVQTPYPKYIKDKAEKEHSDYDFKSVFKAVYQPYFKNYLNFFMHTWYANYDDLLSGFDEESDLNIFLEDLAQTISKKFDCTCGVEAASVNEPPEKFWDLGRLDKHELSLFGMPFFCHMEAYNHIDRIYYEGMDERSETEKQKEAEIYKIPENKIFLFSRACGEGHSNLFIERRDLEQLKFDNTESWYSGG